MVHIFDFRRTSRRGARCPRPSAGASSPDALRKNEAVLAWPFPLGAETQATGRGVVVDNCAVLVADDRLEEP
jgi:hypothetical protein